MEDKRSLRRQILGRRDSFGKVYAVTRALNETPPDKLPAKTVELLEDVLQNRSAAFYFVDAAGGAGMSRREKTPFRMEPFRVDDELHRSIRVENREDAASTVPLEASLALGLAQGRAAQLQRQQLERLLKMQLADQPKEEQYGLGCRLAKVQLELAEYAAAQQTLAETSSLP